MPSIKETLSATMKTSMKSGDKDTLAFCRNLHAVVRKKEIDDRIDLDDAGVLKIIATSIKQRQESIDQFKTGGREDLVEKETRELKFLQAFLPTQMSEAEIKKCISDVMATVTVTGPKDMGVVMKALMPMVTGKADGKLVSQLVNLAIGEVSKSQSATPTGSR